MWLLTNIPGTFLILAVLPRPIRAVGPLVLVFMIAAVAGADLWHNFFDAGGSEVMMRAVRVFGSLGLDNMNAVARGNLRGTAYRRADLVAGRLGLPARAGTALSLALDQRPIGADRLTCGSCSR